MFKCDDYYYKIPVTSTDLRNLETFRLSTIKQTGCFVNYEFIPDINGYRYPAAKYDPLTIDEAKQCLGDLVQLTIEALECIHNIWILHLDVRLENICFDSEYNIKLIDFDRCTSINTVGTKDLYPDSCMYRTTVKHIKRLDWIQLSCVILWVLTESITDHDYHSQTLITKFQETNSS